MDNNARFTHSHDALRMPFVTHSILTLVTKRNASEYDSQQIVSVRDIRDVRGGFFDCQKIFHESHSIRIGT